MDLENIGKKSGSELLNTDLYINMSSMMKDTLTRLIDLGANVNFTNKTSNATPLCYSVMTNNIDIAKLLLEKGANPNIVIPRTGTTPTDTLASHLNNASGLMNNAEQWIKLFLEHKADFNKVSENKLKTTPLSKLSDKGKKVYDNVINSLSRNKDFKA